jgi:hypothetical protein
VNKSEEMFAQAEKKKLPKTRKIPAFNERIQTMLDNATDLEQRVKETDTKVNLNNYFKETQKKVVEKIKAGKSYDH